MLIILNRGKILETFEITELFFFIKDLSDLNKQSTN